MNACPEETRMRASQRGVRPLWKQISGGCSPDRETWKAIEGAGFEECPIEHFTLGIPITSLSAAAAVRGH